MHKADKLPPTLDSLVFHLRRANYQSFIWKSPCSPVLQLPSPEEHGWCLVDGELSQEKMLNAPVPNSIILDAIVEKAVKVMLALAVVRLYYIQTLVLEMTMGNVKMYKMSRMKVIEVIMKVTFRICNLVCYSRITHFLFYKSS